MRCATLDVALRARVRAPGAANVRRARLLPRRAALGRCDAVVRYDDRVRSRRTEVASQRRMPRQRRVDAASIRGRTAGTRELAARTDQNRLPDFPCWQSRGVTLAWKSVAYNSAATASRHSGIQASRGPMGGSNVEVSCRRFGRMCARALIGLSFFLHGCAARRAPPRRYRRLFPRTRVHLRHRGSITTTESDDIVADARTNRAA